MKEILKQPTRLSTRYRRSESKEVKQLLREEAKFFIGDDDVLYRIKSNTNGNNFPACQGKVLLAKYGGRDKAFYLTPMSMSKTKKSYKQGKTPPLPITSSATLEIVGIYFLHLEKFSGGFEYILLIIDHFTRYTQAYPNRNKTTKTGASHPCNDFVFCFGITSQLLHDKEESLRMPFSNTLQTCWISTICEPPLTTEKQKASLKR